MRQDAPMPEPFSEGDPIWVEQAGGEPRPAIYVGEADQASWFGGGPAVYVVFTDTREGAEVGMAQVVRREPGDPA
jgi:hypothetical protein